VGDRFTLRKCPRAMTGNSHRGGHCRQNDAGQDYTKAHDLLASWLPL
jgi:hypothetical protein